MGFPIGSKVQRKFSDTKRNLRFWVREKKDRFKSIKMFSTQMAQRCRENLRTKERDEAASAGGR